VASHEDDLELALELADVADSTTLERFLAEDLVVENKPDLTPVSEADRAVERTIREMLANARPRDVVLGEEYGTGEVAREGARRWIVDPIDGTKNYVRGIPVWATLLALEEGGEVMVAAVSAPALHRRWWAARGRGAFMTDGVERQRRLRVSAVRELADAQLSFAGFEDWEEKGLLDALLELGRRCWRTRAFGDFWGYMLVAEGGVEIACEPVVELWDLAAPKLIVEEAGGRFTDLSGEPRADGGSGLGTNGLLHDAALEILGRLGS
jgi:histidinol-phosphatase